MKILFGGGGSGGHFYPIIAISEALNRIGNEERLIAPSLYFMAPEPYDAGLLFENHLTYLSVSAGKMRRYSSLKNIGDFIKTAWGVLKACVVIFRIFPDVVVGKGGFGSFPALLAARLYGIPVLIHESDSVPGRVNIWAGKFARRVAISFQEAARFFPAEKVAYTGNPIRHALLSPPSAAPLRVGEIEKGTPVIFILGGSQGSVTLNEAIFKILPDLLASYTVVHQTGKANLSELIARAEVLLQIDEHKNRYRPVGYLGTEEIAAVGWNSALIISRAGSALFEIAAWGKPSILIPIGDSNGDHQRTNAYAYSLSGAASVVEEENLTSTILKSEILKIMTDEARLQRMSAAAQNFAKTDAAEVIAREIITMALRHEE